MGVLMGMVMMDGDGDGVSRDEGSHSFDHCASMDDSDDENNSSALFIKKLAYIYSANIILFLMIVLQIF